MKQTIWETWFVASVVILLCLFFVGTADGSVQFFPNFMWFFIPSIINLIVCLVYGKITPTDDRDR